jgi:hypothetical protein
MGKVKNFWRWLKHLFRRGTMADTMGRPVEDCEEHYIEKT